MKTDISWVKNGLYVVFYPENEHAEAIIRDMITQSGDHRFLYYHAPDIIRSLKAAGWAVRKKREKKFVRLDDIYMRLTWN